MYQDSKEESKSIAFMLKVFKKNNLLRSKMSKIEENIEKRLKYISSLMGIDPSILLELNDFIKTNDRVFSTYYTENEKRLKKEYPNSSKYELMYIAYHEFK